MHAGTGALVSLIAAFATLSKQSLLLPYKRVILVCTACLVLATLNSIHQQARFQHSNCILLSV